VASSLAVGSVPCSEQPAVARSLWRPAATEVPSGAAHSAAACPWHETPGYQQRLSHRVVDGHFIGINADCHAPMPKPPRMADGPQVQVGEADRATACQMLLDVVPDCCAGEQSSEAQLLEGQHLRIDTGGITEPPANPVVIVVGADFPPESSEHGAAAGGALAASLAGFVVQLAEVGNGEESHGYSSCGGSLRLCSKTASDAMHGKPPNRHHGRGLPISRATAL
jgi:hypothetical protein